MIRAQRVDRDDDNRTADRRRGARVAPPANGGESGTQRGEEDDEGEAKGTGHACAWCRVLGARCCARCWVSGAVRAARQAPARGTAPCTTHPAQHPAPSTWHVAPTF